MEATSKKPKRKLTDITFDSADSHVSLVSKGQGGPANGRSKALVIKSARTKEFVEKVSQLRITMETPEFLETFFGLWGDRAEVLAKIMGYVEDTEEDDLGNFEPCKSFYEWRQDKMEAANPGVEMNYDTYYSEPTDEEYQQYLNEMVSGIEILKSLNASENKQEAINALSEEDHLVVLKKQAKFEKAKKKFDAAEKKAAKKLTAVKSKTSNGETMTQPNGVDSGSIETVEKAVHESILKQLQDAQALVEVFKAKEKETIEKARFASLKDAIGDEDKATVLFKSLKNIEVDADFEEVVKTLGEVVKAAEATAQLTTEMGVAGSAVEQPKESAVAKAVKARIAKSQVK